MKRIKQLKNKLALTALYIAVLLVFWFLNVPCLYVRFFGIHCPGCGMSRAVFSALKFDFVTAFSYHKMFWSMPVLYLYFLFDGKVFGKKFLDYSIMVLIFLGFLINWLFNLW